MGTGNTVVVVVVVVVVIYCLFINHSTLSLYDYKVSNRSSGPKF